MPHHYHYLGFNGDIYGLLLLSLILLGLVGWLFTSPVVGAVLLFGFVLCLASDPPRREHLDRRVTVFGVTVTVVSLGCVCGLIAWLVHAIVH